MNAEKNATNKKYQNVCKITSSDDKNEHILHSINITNVEYF